MFSIAKRKEKKRIYIGKTYNFFKITRVSHVVALTCESGQHDC